MEDSEVSVSGCSIIELPQEKTSTYWWDVQVPSKTQLLEGFQQPRAPLQVSDKIVFDTGVLAKAKHYLVMSIDIAKIGLTFVLPSEAGESKFEVEQLRISFLKKGQLKVSFLPRVTCQQNILNQNEDFVEAELSLTHSLWTEDADTIRFAWTVKAKLGRLSLRKIHTDVPESNKDEGDEECSSFDFESLCFSEHLADLVIKCQGEKFPAHRTVLCGRSPVFSAMFLHDEMRENKEKVLEIEDINPEIIKEMLRFIYTGKVEQLHELAFELLAASEKYQISGLKRICESFLMQTVTVGNAIQMFGFGDLYNAKRLEEKALNVLKGSKINLRRNREKLREMNKQQPNMIFDLLF